MVAEVDESFGEVAAVDTLAADVRLASVGEVRDPEWCVGVGGVHGIGRQGYGYCGVGCDL